MNKSQTIQRLMSAVCVAGLFSGTFVLNTVSLANQDQNAKLEKLEEDIEKTKQDRDRVLEQVDASRQEMRSITAELIVRARIIQEKEYEMSSLEEDISALQRTERQQLQDLDGKKAHMAETLAALSRLSERPPALGLARPDEAIDTARSASLLANALPELKKEAEAIKTALSEIQSTRLQMDEKKDQLSATLAASVEDKRVLDEFLDRRKQRFQALQSNANELDTKLKRLARNAATLKALLLKLEEDKIERAKAAEDAAERLARRNRSEQRQQNLTAPSADIESLTGKRFAEVKGRMPPPVRGRITQRFGQQLDVEKSKGIKIQTRYQAQVVAPHDGTVVFSGPFRHYGHILILSHDDNYYSLYAGLDQQSAFVGQWVLAGEPLGKMATQDKSPQSQPELYLELRKGGDPINPSPWIKFENRKVTGP